MLRLGRQFGIEFECGIEGGGGNYYNDYIDYETILKVEKSIGKETTRKWSVGEDCGGIEVRTPPSRHYHWKEIGRILARVKEHEGFEGEDWGTHVHLSREGLSRTAQQRFLKLWMSVEDALFGLVDPYRKDSQWCDPLRDNRRIVDDYFPEGKGALHWSYFGTIECRLHHCTLNLKEIKDWTNLLQLLVYYAATKGTMPRMDLNLTAQKQTIRNVIKETTDETHRHALVRALESRWNDPIPSWRH